MAKKKQLTLETRQSIVVLRNEGYKLEDTAKKLGLSLKGVHYTLTRHGDTGSIKDKHRSGRPKCTTAQEDKYIRVSSLMNRRLTAPEIAASLNSTRQTPVCTDTVRRRLRSVGLMGRVAKKKPLLRLQIEKRGYSGPETTKIGALMIGIGYSGLMNQNLKCLDPRGERLSDAGAMRRCWMPV